MASAESTLHSAQSPMSLLERCAELGRGENVSAEAAPARMGYNLPGHLVDVKLSPMPPSQQYMDAMLRLLTVTGPSSSSPGSASGSWWGLSI